MTQAKSYAFFELGGILWPSSLQIPSRRFRLFIAADTRRISSETLAQFADQALKHGMVYFCSWGPGCERFHDIVDEVVVAADLASHPPTNLSRDDTIMTTWHEHKSLDEALEFFIEFAWPTDGLAADSEYWLAFCLNNSGWANEIRGRLNRLGP